MDKTAINGTEYARVVFSLFEEILDSIPAFREKNNVVRLHQESTLPSRIRPDAGYQKTR